MSGLADRRRVLGPPDAVKLSNFESNEVNSISSIESSKIFIKQGTVSNASGSSFVESGSNKIQCSVYGPKPIRGSFTPHAELSVEVEFAPFCVLAEDHGESNSLSKEIASFIQSCFSHTVLVELYPKSAISIVISVISVSGNIKNTLAVAINAASIALSDAGIGLRDIATAASVVLYSNNGKPVFDRSGNVRPLADADVDAVAGFLSAKNDEIVGLWLDGANLSDEKTTESALADCRRQATEIRKVINGVLICHLKEQEDSVEQQIQT